MITGSGRMGRSCILRNKGRKVEANGRQITTHEIEGPGRHAHTKSSTEVVKEYSYSCTSPTSMLHRYDIPFRTPTANPHVLIHDKAESHPLQWKKYLLARNLETSKSPFAGTSGKLIGSQT